MKLDIIKKIEIPEGITLDIGKIIIKAKAASKPAVEKIEKAGGKIILPDAK